MALSPPVTHLRARVAALSRCVITGEREPDDPELTEARRDLRAIRLEEHVAETLAGWPPLTGPQINRVAGLLRAARKASKTNP